MPGSKAKNAFEKGIGYWLTRVDQWSSLGAYLQGNFGVLSSVRQQQLRRRRAKRELDLLTWGRRYLPHYFLRRPSLMHEWLAERLAAIHTRRGTKINVLGPRGGAKSTLGSVCYVLRAALEGWEDYIWIVSDTKWQAEKHLGHVRAELENNQRLSEEYPHSCGRGQRWQKNALQLKNEVVIECYGTGQKVRGNRVGAKRPTLIVCDDIENDLHVESPRQHERSRDWFQTALVNSGDHQTNFLNLATALHRDALAVRLCHTPGWESRVFRSIVQWPTNMALWKEWERIYAEECSDSAGRDAWNFYQTHQRAMDEGHQVLWPDWEKLYDLMKMRVERGEAAFEREKQNSPTDPSRSEWPAAYFDDHIWFDQWPRDPRFKALALDPSKGRDSRHGDYSAFVVLMLDRQGVVYVAADLAHRDATQIVADGVRLCREHGINVLGVEANQFQELLADDFIDELTRQKIDGCTPYKIHNTVPKPVRIRRIGPWLSRRKLRFLLDCPSTEMLIDQLRDFPLGAHDDGPDALEMALRLVEEFQSGGPADDGLGNRLLIGN